MILKGVVFTCNYPDDEIDAIIPKQMSVEELQTCIAKLIHNEPEMTSFVITAAIDRST